MQYKWVKTKSLLSDKLHGWVIAHKAQLHVKYYQISQTTSYDKTAEFEPTSNVVFCFSCSSIYLYQLHLLYSFLEKMSIENRGPKLSAKSKVMPCLNTKTCNRHWTRKRVCVRQSMENGEQTKHKGVPLPSRWIDREEGQHKEIVCLSRWNPLVLLYPVGGEGATQ